MPELDGDQPQPRKDAREGKFKAATRRFGEKLGIRRNTSNPREVLEDLAQPSEAPVITVLDATPPENIAVIEEAELHEVKNNPDARGEDNLGFPSDQELLSDIGQAASRLNQAKISTDESRKAADEVTEAGKRALRAYHTGEAEEEYQKAKQALSAALNTPPANPSDEYIAAAKALQDAKDRYHNRTFGKTLHEALHNPNLEKNSRMSSLNSEETRAATNKFLRDIKKLSDEELLSKINDTEKQLADGQLDNDKVKLLSERWDLAGLNEEAANRGLNIAGFLKKNPDIDSTSGKPYLFESKGPAPEASTGLEDFSVEDLKRKLSNLKSSGLPPSTMEFLRKSIEEELKRKNT